MFLFAIPILLASITLIVTNGLAQATGQAAQEFEMASALRASEVLSGVSLVGPNYRIEASVAFFAQRPAGMLTGYHVNMALVARLAGVVNASFAQREDGTIIRVFPPDHVPWARSVSRNVTGAVRAINKLPNFTGVELWVAGTVSPLTRRNLEAMGFRVKENTEEKLSLK